MADSKSIADYYNANTRKFLSLGGSGDTAAIHRAIWAPGVHNKRDALLYLNRFVAEHIQPVLGEQPELCHVLDLGCGTGGTALFLAKRCSVQVIGVTLSAVQTQIARENAAQQNATAQSRFITADFAQLPPLPQCEALYGIESFAHAQDPEAFFAMAARLLKHKGRLLLCDDFLGDTSTPKAKQWVERIRSGWHLNNLISPNHCQDIAAQQGFRLLHDEDLSAYLRAFPAPLLLGLNTLTRIPLPWAYWHNLSGGTSLQICVQQAWTQYRAMVWEKC